MNHETEWIENIIKYNCKESFNLLINSYYKNIYAFVYRQTLNKELSKDITQDIFIKVMKSIHRYKKNKSSFKTYLYRIARNHVIDIFRSKQYQMNKDLIELDDEKLVYNIDLLENVIREEEIKYVNSLIQLLSIKEQEIIRLRFYADCSLKEISDINGYNLSTVKSILYQALKKIKNWIQEGERVE